MGFWGFGVLGFWGGNDMPFSVPVVSVPVVVRPSDTRTAQNVWRRRAAQMWGTVDPEQLAFPLQYARARASGRGHGGGDD